MRKIILILFLNLFVLFLYGQDYSKLRGATFKSSVDYKKAEKQVLECSNYLLENPSKKDELNRLFAIQYITKWVNVDNGHKILINLKFMNYADENIALKTIYFASKMKVILEKPESNMDPNDIEKKTFKYIEQYCAIPENELKLKKPTNKTPN